MSNAGTAPRRGRPRVADVLRRRASSARKLANEVTDPNWRARLVEYAAELDARADAKEKAAESRKNAPLRVTMGLIRWEGSAPAMVQPALAPSAYFSSRTNRLIEDARKEIARAAKVRGWQMPVRRSFGIRPG